VRDTAPVDGVLCPIVVGRDTELATLVELVGAAAAGRGRLVCLVGEAGVGKSRLVREVTAHAGGRRMMVLSGRAVPGASPLPFRPLTEALLVAGRAGGPPEARELAGFGGQLARLVPDWGVAAPGGADESPVLVGEAVLRLLRVLGRAEPHSGCLLVLEDMHWSDAETLAVVDYLADTVAEETVLCLLTTRPEPTTPVTDLVERIRARAACTVMRLPVLTADEQHRMARACLADDTAVDEVAGFVVEHSDGVPFLVEELLAGLAASGALRRVGARWVIQGPLAPAVPVSLVESVRSRLAALDRDGRQVLGAAAVLGRRFDWDLLPGVANVDGATAVEALRAAIRDQLVVAEGRTFRFRHALTREAVLAELLPPERATLSARGLVAVRRAHPDLAGSWCELAAELAEAAGDQAESAALLTESARRALARGALISAEVAARRARHFAPVDSRVGEDADEVLVRVLAAAGKSASARELGAPLLDRLEDGRRRADLALVLARAAIAVGDYTYTAAAADVARARRTAAEPDPGFAARVAAVEGHVALEQEQPDEAARVAESAVGAARHAALPEVECEALEVLGRVSRMHDRAAAVACFEQAARLAETHDLPVWQLRARHELAMLAAWEGGPRPLHEVRKLAANAGALVSVAQMDMLLADFALSRLDYRECNTAARNCVELSRRLGLASLPVALLWRAGASAMADDEAAMETALWQAEQSAPGDPRILGDAWGRVRATRHALREDRARFRHALDASMPFVRAAPPARSVFGGRIYWALLSTMDDEDLGMAARDELQRSRLATSPLHRLFGLMDAVALGRQGRRDEAFELAAESVRSFDAAVMFGAPLVFRLVAEAAVRDGWGDPVPWLRDAQAFFAQRGFDKVARACRALLKTAGAPVPRRGRGESAVPAQLRAIGVTSREMDVLKLIAEGLPNREIAQRLYLSPRTVEHHVTSLLRRTGAPSRAALGTAVSRNPEVGSGN
jgi:DNA-binding CsgD family transcriptional regulator